MRYIPLYLLIQAASLVLTLLGLPICAYLAWHTSTPLASTGLFHWRPRWAWIWDNMEDGVMPVWYRQRKAGWSDERIKFYWTALRNPCNNLRYVPGVSRVGRPLWRVEWKTWYFQAGWRPTDGWPVLSGGKIYAP